MKRHDGVEKEEEGTTLPVWAAGRREIKVSFSEELRS